MARLVLILAAMLMSSVSVVADDGFWLGADYRAGHADGHVQVPAGGEPGTSSVHRPNLNELGIDSTRFATVDLGYRWGSNELFLGYQCAELEGSNRLHEQLITHGETIPAGSLVTAEILLTTIDLGYRYHFRRGDFDLAPAVGITFFGFNYQMSAEDGMDTERTFTKMAPMVGLSAEWRPDDGPFALTAVLSTTVAWADGLPHIAREEILVSYRVVQDKRSLTAYFGLGLEQVQYDDGYKQDFANQIDVNFGPMFIIGLQFAF